MSKLNIQQLPKVKKFLKCFIPKPGHKLLYSDVNSLEPHVLAHFSKDPGLMALYGPDAKPNDVYLFVGSRIGKWKDNILKYYDPNAPTPEAIALAKKLAKKERTAVKAPYLGWSYGLGAATMSENTGITREECKKILADIDATFPGVATFKKNLEEIWTEHGGWAHVEWLEDSTGRRRPHFVDGESGWIWNGRNRPIGIAPDKKKDIGNRFVQSTGHDLLLQLLSIINEERRGTTMTPYNVDMHDATIWQVRDDEAETGKQIIEYAYDQLNDILQWDVQIRGDVEIGNNLGDFLE